MWSLLNFVVYRDGPGLEILVMRVLHFVVIAGEVLVPKTDNPLLPEVKLIGCVGFSSRDSHSECVLR